MATVVKNDRMSYRKREIAAPKEGQIVRREGASELFFLAPVNGYYLDLRRDTKPRPPKKD